MILNEPGWIDERDEKGFLCSKLRGTLGKGRQAYNGFGGRLGS